MTDITTFLQNGTTQPIPPCISMMKMDLIEYIPGQSLTISCPVQELFINGGGVMQGGFIAVALDNAFGILRYLETKSTNMATIDLQVNYHRPLTINDRLIITSHLKHLGSTITAMYAEGFNSEGKLVTTATTNMITLSK